MLIATQNPKLHAGEFLLGLAVIIPDRFPEFLKRQLSQKLGAAIHACTHQNVFLRHFTVFEDFLGCN